MLLPEETWAEGTLYWIAPPLLNYSSYISTVRAILYCSTVSTGGTLVPRDFGRVKLDSRLHMRLRNNKNHTTGRRWDRHIYHSGWQGCLHTFPLHSPSHDISFCSFSVMVSFLLKLSSSSVLPRYWYKATACKPSGNTVEFWLVAVWNTNGYTVQKD